MSPSDKNPSLAIVGRARRGDPDAVQALIEQYWPEAYRIAYSVVRDHHQAEDAAQDGCARILAGLGSLRNPRAFVPWARRTVIRAACSCIRATWRQLPAVPLSDRLEGAAAAAPDLDLEVRIGQLQSIYRVPLVLRYGHGYSSSEIGRMLDLPAATVRSRLKAARERLRRTLTEEESMPTHVRLPIARKGAH